MQIRNVLGKISRKLDQFVTMETLNIYSEQHLRYSLRSDGLLGDRRWTALAHLGMCVQGEGVLFVGNKPGKPQICTAAGLNVQQNIQILGQVGDGWF